MSRPRPSKDGPTRAYGQSEFERLLGDSAVEPATRAMVALDTHRSRPSPEASPKDSPDRRPAKRRADPLMTEAAPIVVTPQTKVPETTAPKSRSVSPDISHTLDRRQRQRQTLFLCAGIFTIAAVGIALFAAHQDQRPDTEAAPVAD